MSLLSTFIFLVSFATVWSPLVTAKVFMVVMEDDPVMSYQEKQVKTRPFDTMMQHKTPSLGFNLQSPIFGVPENWSDNNVITYKENMINGHDMFLESVLQTGSYTKLYSYTHLLNGFALHITSEEAIQALHNAKRVRIIQEDRKMEKLTTHTPDFLGIPNGVWPSLGGAQSSGEGVVIGIIDTGINPNHPSFANQSSRGANVVGKKFKGQCDVGESSPRTICGGKIVGARYFARGAIAAGDFNATRDYSSPYDADGHGSHTASTAAGNNHIHVTVNGFSYGYASGMAPGAGIAVYKALYSFGGYMADVVAAVDQAVEDGVDILSLSIGPSTIPPGPSAFLNVLEMELLFATKAGVLVVQAAGNGGPSSSSILSFSPWITSVAASITDRKYNNSIQLGNGQTFFGIGLAPPTSGQVYFPIAAAIDVCITNKSYVTLKNCQHSEPFIPSLVRGKLIICTYTFEFEFAAASIAVVADTMQKVGAAGFIMTMDNDLSSTPIRGTALTFRVPGIVLNNMEASTALWEYYNSNTNRNRLGRAQAFTATARILDGRQATYTGQAPIVASYSSRGPDVNNAQLQTADILKPNVMAPGSSIWAAWSPNSEGDYYSRGQNFALASGTSMAAPHIAGVAALIKQKHPKWTPAAITSAMMTTADTTDHQGAPILAQHSNQLARATPFDFGSGFVNPARAIDPGLIFDADFKHYIQFLCAVPGVDSSIVRQAVGVGCPEKKIWCSDLNTASVTVSNLVGSRTVTRKVTGVARKKETYQVIVHEPLGVSVSVSPRNLTIKETVSKHIKIELKATEATNGYCFGELVLQGNRKHVVRIPLAVYVTSALKS